MENKILTGSKAFFKDIEGFKSKDSDYIVFIEPNLASFDFLEYSKEDGYDVFKIVKYSKDILINKILEFKKPQAICTLLIPEIIKMLNITIEDLTRLKPLRDKLNEFSHYEYLGLIYDCYIKNNSFILTDEQLQEVYANYCEKRPKTLEKKIELREKNFKKYHEFIAQRRLEKMKKNQLI